MSRFVSRTNLPTLDVYPLPAVDSAAHSSDAHSLAGVGPDSRYGIRTCIAWVLAIRLTILVVGVVSALTFKGPWNQYASHMPWVAWDAMHYRTIITGGYAPNGDPTPLIAYFPGYPLAVRLVHAVSGLPVEASMLLLSNACAAVGVVYLYKWASKLVGQRAAFVCAIVISSFPGAVFYSAGLTEGPFLLLTALALWLMSEKRWYAAAAAAGLATFTRPTAGAASAMLVLAFLVQKNPMLHAINWKQRVRHAALLSVVSLFGAISYQSFLWANYGRFDTYVRAQEYWEHENDKMLAAEAAKASVPVVMTSAEAPPPARYSLRFFLDRASTPQAWNRAMAWSMLAICAFCIVKRTPVPRVLFVMPFIVFFMGYLPNHGLRASSVMRYEMASVPMFLAVAIYLARPNRRVMLFTFLGLCMTIQVYYAFAFSRGIWVG